MRAHIKETSKSALLALCEGNSPVTGEFPTQRAATRKRLPSILVRRHLYIESAPRYPWSLSAWKGSHVVSMLPFFYANEKVTTPRLLPQRTMYQPRYISMTPLYIRRLATIKQTIYLAIHNFQIHHLRLVLNSLSWWRHQIETFSAGDLRRHHAHYDVTVNMHRKHCMFAYYSANSGIWS